MNIIEREMLRLLKDLKTNYNVISVKAEFEAEGSRIEEMMRLKDITARVPLPIILKIGGAEAVTDIYNGVILGVEGLVSPMIETAYAASKFLDVINSYVQPDNQEDIDFAINIETITALKNIHEILSLDKIALLSSITFGRSDFSRSLGLTKKEVDNETIYSHVENVAYAVRNKNMHFAIGGNITAHSVPFLKRLYQKKLIDKYETRKIVFSANALLSNPEEGIHKALEFELLWLKSKRRFYSKIKEEDEQRIEDLEKRLNVLS